MKYYAQINSKNKLTNIDMSQIVEDEYGSKDVQNIEVSEDIYLNREKYIFENNELIINPKYEEEKLQSAKNEKYQEVLKSANDYISNGFALYNLDENTSIEATDGNIGKLTAYALGFITGQLNEDDTIFWTTKEDKTVELGQNDIIQILKGLGEKQAEIWNYKFTNYVKQIEMCKTPHEIDLIEVNYDR